jgi:tetratricopeptide (TPR) repeat protein
VLFERKHILEAHRYALKSLNWNPTPRSYELLGKILISEGKMAEAKKIFEEGLIFVPEQNKEERIAADRIRLNLAALAANQTDFAECRKYLAEIKSSISQTSDALYLKGMLLSQDNKPDEALKLFEKALHESPENPRIMNAVGYLLTRNEKDLERAEMLLETAHQLLKSSETPMLSDMLMIAHSLGTLYWKQGKLEEAGKLLEIAWEKCPDTWETVKVGRYQDLIRFYQETGNDQALARLTGETASTTPDISGKESTEAEKTEND